MRIEASRLGIGFSSGAVAAPKAMGSFEQSGMAALSSTRTPMLTKEVTSEPIRSVRQSRTPGDRAIMDWHFAISTRRQTHGFATIDGVNLLVKNEGRLYGRPSKNNVEISYILQCIISAPPQPLRHRNTMADRFRRGQLIRVLARHISVEIMGIQHANVTDCVIP